MKRVLNILMMVVLMCVGALCTTVTSTTKIIGPDGQPFNGTITLQLPFAGVNSQTNQLVLATPVTANVFNGVIIPAMTVTGNDIMSPAMPYSALYTDLSGNPITRQLYYITGTTFDVGSAPATPNFLNSQVAFANNITVTGNVSVGGGLNIGTGEVWVTPSQSISLAIAAIPSGGIVHLQAGTYAQSTTTIAMKRSITMAGCGSNCSFITYSGSGAAISMDSVDTATIRDLQIQIGSSATAIGIDMQNTTNDNKWNLLENININTTALTTGQIGIRFMASTTFALYWNHIRKVVTNHVDTGFRLTNLGAFSANGANENQFYDVTCHFFTTCWWADKFATENHIYSIGASASGNLAASTVVIIGDGSVAANNNEIHGLDSDTGANGQAFQIKTNAARTFIGGVVDAGSIASSDAGTATTLVAYRNANTSAIETPVIVTGATSMVPDAKSAYQNNGDSSFYNTFSNAPWAMRALALSNGTQSLTMGINKTAADGNYIAKTGNTGSVAHTMLEFLTTGIINYNYQAHVADGSTLALGTVFQIDPTQSPALVTVVGKITAQNQLASTVATGTAPLAITSTTPVANLTLTKHPTEQNCGTTTTCSATADTSVKIVRGSAPLVSGTPSVATVTGFSPIFTSSSSFVCTATNATTQANPIKVVNASSSSITLTGPNTVTDTVNYICVGT